MRTRPAPAQQIRFNRPTETQPVDYPARGGLNSAWLMRESEDAQGSFCKFGFTFERSGGVAGPAAPKPADQALDEDEAVDRVSRNENRSTTA